MAYVRLFGLVSGAERFDTDRGDSAVSLVLYGELRTYEEVANSLLDSLQDTDEPR